MSKKPDYDPCLDIADRDDDPYKPATLDGFMEGEAEAPSERDWKKHWRGMPSYQAEDRSPIASIKINLWTEEDRDAFAELIGQPITPKTKSLTWPKREKSNRMITRWVDDETYPGEYNEPY